MPTTGGFKGGAGALTDAQTAALALQSDVGGVLTLTGGLTTAGDVTTGNNNVVVGSGTLDGVDLGAKSAALALISESSGALVTSGGINTGGDVDVGGNAVTSLGAPGAPDDAATAGGGRSQLANVTNFASPPAGWRVGTPSASDSLTYATAYTWAAGQVTVKTAHTHSYWTHDHPVAPMMLAHDITDTQAGTVTVKFNSLANQTDLVGSVFWGAFIVVVFGGSSTKGAYGLAKMLFAKGAAGTGGDPSWYVMKTIKQQNVATHTNSDKFTVQEGPTPIPGGPHYLRLEWHPSGFKVWHSTDDDTYNEVGGGSVLTGYVDPVATTVADIVGESIPAVSQSVKLLIGCAQNYSSATVQADIESITFTGVS